MRQNQTSITLCRSTISSVKRDKIFFVLVVTVLYMCNTTFAFVQNIKTQQRQHVLRRLDDTTIISTSSGRLPKSKPVSSTKTKLNMINVEDIIYQTESAANSLAQFSLTSDPSNLLTSLPILYLAGLLTSLSPCVWGLLPLTMSYISNAAGDRQDQSTTLPTLAFAAGLAAVFCTLGVAAVELGGVFGSTGSNSILLPILSNFICLAMGLKLLELIELPLPSFDFANFKGATASTNTNGPILIDGTGQIISNKVRNDERGSLVRTFLLGGSSALVASPCATPVLTSILAFVASASNPFLGATLLFGYTLGYSTPLLLVAATGGQALVKIRSSGGGGIYSKIAPWVTPITGGILLWYGTNGMLTTLFGDPSMAGLMIID